MDAQFEAGLAYTEHNNDRESTILLIHGGFATGREWDGVVSLLHEYHILIPDLPGHGRSQAGDAHFSLHQCVEQIARLTQRLAKHGKADVVGVSIGAHIGAHLVSKHAELINSYAVLSGFNYYTNLNPTVLATPAWIMSRLSYTFASSKSQEDSEFTKTSWRMCVEVASVITTGDWPEPWPARTLIIAAGKKGPLPVSDSDDDAKRLEGIGQQACKATSAYKNMNIQHAWHKDNPQLFADTVLAWSRAAALPEGFVKL